jgi:excisionase family DNA binding protein
MFDSNESTNKFMKVSEVAKELCVSTVTVRAMIYAGQIAPAHRAGGLLLIPRTTFEDFMRRSVVQSVHAQAA